MASRRARRPRRNPSDQDLRRLAREAAFDPDAADRLEEELYRAREIEQRYYLPARISYHPWHLAFAESTIWARIENLEGPLADLPWRIMYSVIAQDLIDQSSDPALYHFILDQDWDWFVDGEPASRSYEIMLAGEPTSHQFRAAIEDLAPNPQRRQDVNHFLGLVWRDDMRQAARFAGYLPNPPLGADWLTPRVAARLGQIEDRLVRSRSRLYGPREGLLVCEDAWLEAQPIVSMESGQDAQAEFGLVRWPGIGKLPEGGQGAPADAYWHWWLRLDDGSIVDVAARQFGQRSPLVIPPDHPLQRRYLPEAVDSELGAQEEVWDRRYHRNPPYYHSSCAKLKPNQRLRPKPWGDLTPHKQFVERVFEEERPGGMPSRIHGVFMSQEPGQYMPRCPGGDAGIYEVRTKGPVHKFDMDHFNDAGAHISGLASSAPYLRSVRIDDPEDVKLYEPGVREAARRYWKGWQEYDWIDPDCADPDYSDPDCEFERGMAKFHNQNLEILTEEPVYVRRRVRRNPSPEDRELSLRRRAAAGDVEAEEALERELRRRVSTGVFASYQNAWSRLLAGDHGAAADVIAYGASARTKRGLESELLSWRPELISAYNALLNPELGAHFEAAVVSALNHTPSLGKINTSRLNGINVFVATGRDPRVGDELEVRIDVYLNVEGIEFDEEEVYYALELAVNDANEEIADEVGAAAGIEILADPFDAEIETENEDEVDGPTDLVVNFRTPLELYHLFWAYDILSRDISKIYQ